MKYFLIMIGLVMYISRLQAQPVYKQDFEDPSSWTDFNFSQPGQWQLLEDEKGNISLAVAEVNDYQPPYRSPRSIALLDNYWLEDFVLEVDLKQNGVPHDCKGESCMMCNHRDMCIFWNFQDSSHFYYAHIAARPDEVSHQIHIVNEAARTPVTSYRNEGIDWGKDAWQRIKVVHSADNGETSIFFNDMQNPVLVTQDNTLKGGYIGFGSFDELGQIDNIRLVSTGHQLKKSDTFSKD